jgi:hypothetical protein
MKTGRIILLLFGVCSFFITYAQPFFDVTEFGAVPNAEHTQTEVLQNTIDACAEAGGGTVFLPPGIYQAATLVLKKNVILHLSAGAQLVSSRDESEFRKFTDAGFHASGLPVQVFAANAENIGITGAGTIDGKAEYFLDDLEEVDNFVDEEFRIAREAGIPMKKYKKIPPLTVMIFFNNCRNITFREASFLNSMHWGIHLKSCRDVIIDGIKIYSSLEKGANSDGLDIDGCSNVAVSNCIIETGDDAIVLKTTDKDGPATPCENITVNNCVLTSTSAALKLGTESFADYRHIIFSNCIIRNTNRGLAIIIRDGATAENILFSNIIIDCRRKDFFWWGSGDPIWLVVTKRNENSKIGHIRNVFFSNIRATGQGTTKIEGHNERPLENIQFSDVSLHMKAEERMDKRAVYGFLAHDVTGLEMNHFKLTWNKQNQEIKWMNGAVFENITGLKWHEVSIDPAPGKKEPAILFRNAAQ